MADDISKKIYDSIIRNSIDVEMFAEGTRAKVVDILQKAQTEIAKQIAGIDPYSPTITKWREERLQKLNARITEIVGQSYKDIKDTTKKDLTDVARAGFTETPKLLNTTVGVNLFDVTLTPELLTSTVTKTMIDGHMIGEWWDKQSTETKDRLIAQMRKVGEELQLGLVKGESIGEMINRVRGTATTPGVMSLSKREAAALVRTSTHQVLQDVRKNVYKQNEDVLRGYQICATLDMRTTPLCRGLDGKEYDLEFRPIGHSIAYPPGPPFHWNCRTTLIPITKSYRELMDDPDLTDQQRKALDEIKDPGVRASMGGPVPGHMNYNDWLLTQPQDVQMDVLGRARWQLWKDNNLGMEDLIHQTGKQLTIEELKARLAGDYFTAKQLETLNWLEAQVGRFLSGDEFAAYMDTLPDSDYAKKVLAANGETPLEFYVSKVKVVEPVMPVPPGPDYKWADVGKVNPKMFKDFHILNIDYAGTNLQAINSIGRDYCRVLNDFPEVADIMKNNPLRQFILTDGRYVAKRNIGQYSWDKLELSIDRYWGIEPARVSKGGWHPVLGNTNTDVFRHELGHHLQYTFFKKAEKEKVWGEWEFIFNSHSSRWWESNVSKYATTNHMEAFAESFSLYTSPFYERGMLKPQIESFLDEIFNKAKLKEPRVSDYKPFTLKDAKKELSILKRGKGDKFELEAFERFIAMGDGGEIKVDPMGFLNKVKTLAKILRGEEDAFVEAMIESPGKLMREMTEADMRMIYSGLKGRLTTGGIPGPETKPMKIWESLTQEEHKRILDMWVSKGAKIPDSFMTKYYPKSVREMAATKLDEWTAAKAPEMKAWGRLVSEGKIAAGTPTDEIVRMVEERYAAMKAADDAAKVTITEWSGEASVYRGRYSLMKEMSATGKIPPEATPGEVVKAVEDAFTVERKKAFDEITAIREAPVSDVRRAAFDSVGASRDAVVKDPWKVLKEVKAEAVKITETRAAEDAAAKATLSEWKTVGGLEHKTWLEMDAAGRVSSRMTAAEIVEKVKTEAAAIADRARVAKAEITSLVSGSSKNTWAEKAYASMTDPASVKMFMDDPVAFLAELRKRMAELEVAEAKKTAEAAVKVAEDFRRGGGKTAKDYTEGDMRMIYSSLRGALAKGRIPAPTTKPMVIWDSLADEEHKRILDMWVRKGLKVPEEFSTKYYPTGIPAPTAAPKVVAPVKDVVIETASKPLNMDEYIQYKGQGGSNKGAYYYHKDNPADRWYFKFPEEEARVHNELLAAKLYKYAGVEVADVTYVDGVIDGKAMRGIASRIVDGIEKTTAEKLATLAGCHENFVVDAWLANWDVVGGAYDNMLMKDGARALRLDPGGSLIYRARGGLKGDAFGKKVTELETLKNSPKNPEATAVFKNITKENLKVGCQKVINFKDDDIRKLVDAYGPGDAAARRELADKLIARKQYIQNYYDTVLERKAPPIPDIPDLVDRQLRTLQLGNERGQMNAQAYKKLQDMVGLTKEQADALSENIASQLRFCTNIPLEQGKDSDVYKALFQECDLKNQFVRGREAQSRGSLAPYKSKDYDRDSWEHTLSNGILHENPVYKKMKNHDYFTDYGKEGIDAAWERPYYGFVMDSNNIDAARQYGGVTMIFKKDVITQRATYSLGNSSGLSSTSVKERCGTAAFNRPLLENLTRTGRTEIERGLQEVAAGTKNINQVGLHYSGYVEAQYYGRLRLDRDIELMVWRRDDSPPEYIKKFADRWGLRLINRSQLIEMLANGEL